MSRINTGGTCPCGSVEFDDNGACLSCAGGVMGVCSDCRMVFVGEGGPCENCGQYAFEQVEEEWVPDFVHELPKQSKSSKKRRPAVLNPLEQMLEDLAEELRASGLTELALEPPTDTNRLTATFVPRVPIKPYQPKK
jgi:hypothetical protein